VRTLTPRAGLRSALPASISLLYAPRRVGVRARLGSDSQFSVWKVTKLAEVAAVFSGQNRPSSSRHGLSLPRCSRAGRSQRRVPARRVHRPIGWPAMAISVRTCRTTASIVALILSSGVQQPHAREMGRHNASDCVDGFIHLMFGRSRLFSATRSRVNSALAAVNRAWAFAQPRQIFQSGLVLIEFAVGQAIDHMLIGKGGDPLSDEPEMRGKLCCGDAGSRPCPSPERQGNQSCSGVVVSTLPAGGSLIGKKP
jgi:hypothetical protein